MQSTIGHLLPMAAVLADPLYTSCLGFERDLYLKWEDQMFIVFRDGETTIRSSGDDGLSRRQPCCCGERGHALLCLLYLSPITFIDERIK